MSTFFELLKKRESCRNFSDKPVSRELLEKALEYARLSPSACNSQPWYFRVATGVAAQKVKSSVQFMGGNKFTENCPAFIVITETPAKLSERVGSLMGMQYFAQIDIGIVTAHLTCGLCELGLSSCILGWLDEKKLEKDLEIGKNEKIRLVIAVGYSADAAPREKKRRDMEEISTFLS